MGLNPLPPGGRIVDVGPMSVGSFIGLSLIQQGPPQSKMLFVPETSFALVRVQYPRTIGQIKGSHSDSAASF